MIRMSVRIAVLSVFIACTAGCTGQWQSLGALLGAGFGATTSSNADVIAIGELINATAGALNETSRDRETH